MSKITRVNNLNLVFVKFYILGLCTHMTIVASMPWQLVCAWSLFISPSFNIKTYECSNCTMKLCKDINWVTYNINRECCKQSLGEDEEKKSDRRHCLKSLHNLIVWADFFGLLILIFGPPWYFIVIYCTNLIMIKKDYHQRCIFLDFQAWNSRIKTSFFYYLCCTRYKVSRD